MPSKQKSTIKKLSIKPHIDVYSRGSYEWINVTDTGSRVFSFLTNELGLTKDDAEYITQKNPRAKLVTRDQYSLFIMRFPYHRKQDNTIHSSHVSFIVTKKQVITVHHNKLEALRTFEKNYTPILSASTPSNNFSPAQLIGHLLTALYTQCFPLTDTISEEIDSLEEKIYKPELANAETVKNIFTIDRKVIDTRRVMRSHLWLSEHIIELMLQLKPNTSTQTLLHQAGSLPHSIWNTLESQMESIDSMQTAYESLTSYRLNDIIRILTIISIVIAPLTLISGIFGMNFRHIPYAYHPFGFLFIIFLMLIVSLWAILFFKKKKWL